MFSKDEGGFPVSVSLGVLRAGKGNGLVPGQLELVAAVVAGDDGLGGEFGQGGAERGGAHGAELAQALDGGGLGQLGQSLADTFGGGRHGRWSWRGFSGRPHGQREG